MVRLPSAAREQAPGLGLLAALLLLALLGHGLPGPDLVAAGLVGGAALALQVMGLLLVFRSDRVINFAQLQLGLVGGALFAVLVQRHQVVRWLAAGCPGCLPADPAQAPGWLLGAEYALAALAGLVVAAGLGALAYLLLLRRFREAPRLVLTVATIGLALVAAWLEAQVPSWFVTTDAAGRTVGADRAAGSVAPPFHLAFSLGTTRFQTADVPTLVAALVACAGLALFLARTRAGGAVRGAADNPDRARTLGIDVDGTGALVWLIAGLLSGVSGLLDATAGRLDTGAPLGVEPLVAVLAAALVARFASLPVGVAAALVLGLAAESSLRWFGTSDPYQAVLIAVIVLALLLPGGRRGRAARDAEAGWLGAREVRPVPAALARLPQVQAAARWLAAGALVLVVGAPLALSPAQVELLSVAAVYALIGLSLLVLTGWAGQISLGQFALAAFGAYASAVLALGYGLPFPLTLVAGAAAGAAAAGLLGVPALRLQGLNLAVLTLAVAVAVPQLLLNPSYLGAALQNQVLNRPFFLGLDLNDERAYYFVCLAVLAAAGGAVYALRRSRTGRALIAARENEDAARALGINLFRARLGAFVTSGCLAGLAGALLAYLQRGVPVLTYGPDASVQLFLMAVIGGLGSPAGPLLGAAYLALASALPGQLSGFLLSGAGVLLVLLFSPGGLVQVVFGARDAWLRRLALHHRVEAPSLLGARGLRGGRVPLLPPRAGAAAQRRYRLEAGEASGGS